MTGLFTGIIGSLIGAGIQATVGGIPIQEDAYKALDVLRLGGLPVPPENWFTPKSSSEHSTQQTCGKIGQHVAGAMQVLGPCMQITKALQDIAYPGSQPQSVRAWTPQDASCKSAKVNDPLLLTGTMAHVKKEGKCLRLPVTTSSTRVINSPITKTCKLREHFFPELIKPIENKKTKKSGEKPGNNSPSNNFCKAQETGNIRPKANVKNKVNSLMKAKILPKANGKKGKTDPRERDMKAHKFMITAGISKDSKCRPFCHSSTVKKQSVMLETQTKLSKPRNQSGKLFRGEKCLMCQAQIKEIKIPPLLPCGHIVCYQCLTGQTLLRCPKCGLKFE